MLMLPPRKMRRREVLQTALAAAAVTPRPQVPPAATPDWLGAIVARATALGGPGLLLSYEVDGKSPFDRTHANCAYVYDNAAAGLALLQGHTDLARRLGDALVQAQAHDRFWQDGRLRNAYKAGAAPATGPYPLPGYWDAVASRWTEDAYQVGTATGVVAWAMLVWLALARATGDGRYTQAASRAGDWVIRTTQVTRGYSGGFLGFEPGPERLGWASTEHNLDLAVAFAGLGRAAAAAHAQSFLENMWDSEAGRFMTGLRPDGSLNDTPAADANLWPILLPGAMRAWTRAFGWVMTHLGVPEANPQGVDFNDDRDGIWLEGTAYAAMVARQVGPAALAARMRATLAAQTAPSGMVYASSVPRLTTGLSTGLTTEPDFYYYRRAHLGATAWAALKSTPFALP
jgi:hypothetical protein